MSRFSSWMKSVWRATSAIAAAATIVVAFVAGWMVRGGTGPAAAPPPTVADAAAAEYTCSMHPQVRLPDPGAKCPICFMDLVRVPSGGEAGTEGDRTLVMSPAAVGLAEIRTAPVIRAFPRRTVRMFGNIDFDETRIATIAAYFPGRLDRLYVDYTGIPVPVGDHLVSIYSPELVTAESELVTQRRSLDRMRESVNAETLRSFEATIEGTREKLRLWGLAPEQIAEIEETGQTSDHLTIYSPMGGVVIEKHKVKGDYVKTGEAIFSIADLSRLWLGLDVYESDLQWIRHGQDVAFTTVAFPGAVFHGKVSFIDPQVSPDTRTVRLRVNVDNTDGRLKPGMFVRATVRPVVGGGGAVIAEAMAGRWVCPMHPEVIEAEQKPCSLCGMDLVEAETLGYVTSPNVEPPPLVIPATAPLITGRRAIVYVRIPGRAVPTFEGREVVLGARAGDVYMIPEDVPGGPALAEGDLVVVNGAFKIDSALQIEARPSMMTAPEAGADEAGTDEPGPHLDVTGTFLAGLEPVYEAYLAAGEALAGDDLRGFSGALRALPPVVRDVDAQDLDGAARWAWRTVAESLRAEAAHVDHVADLGAARALFDRWSAATIEIEQRFGHVGPGSRFVIFCPMAFDDRGASWLAPTRDVRNPYFGTSMLRCGSVKAAHPPRDAGAEGGGS